jgi:hypothetical protein
MVDLLLRLISNVTQLGDPVDRARLVSHAGHGESLDRKVEGFLSAFKLRCGLTGGVLDGCPALDIGKRSPYWP